MWEIRLSNSHHGSLAFLNTFLSIFIFIFLPDALHLLMKSIISIVYDSTIHKLFCCSQFEVWAEVKTCSQTAVSFSTNSLFFSLWLHLCLPQTRQRHYYPTYSLLLPIRCPPLSSSPHPTPSLRCGESFLLCVSPPCGAERSGAPCFFCSSSLLFTAGSYRTRMLHWDASAASPFYHSQRDRVCGVSRSAAPTVLRVYERNRCSGGIWPKGWVGWDEGGQGWR